MKKHSSSIVLITGGASGMGLACADTCAQAGYTVVVWDKNPLPPSYQHSYYPCDVTSEASVESAMAKTKADIGVPRILIQCAGIAPAKRIIGKQGPMPLSAFEQVIQINLIGTFNVMKTVSHAMMGLDIDLHTQERGVIINTASIAAYEGQIGQAAYSASKGGVVSMTLPAAREFAAYAIRVNTIAPGFINTPMVQGMPENVQESLLATTVFPKRFGLPDEFAALALHVIQNQYINGTVIRLDGAVRMGAV